MKPISIIVVAALTGSLYGQAAFDAASIRENAGGPEPRGTIQASPGSLVMRNTTLREAISWAYDEPGVRVGVLEGPKWADTVRYDIVARPADAASNTQLRIMLRALLADRFKLVVRAEKRESAIYALTVDPKGHKLRPSTTTGGRLTQPDAIGLAFHNTTMSDLQLFLLSVPGLDRPVINRTGVEGAFDFTLALPPAVDPNQPLKGITGGILTLADALAPLGLRLEPQKVPLDVITIEKAEKPSAN